MKPSNIKKNWHTVVIIDNDTREQHLVSDELGEDVNAYTLALEARKEGKKAFLVAHQTQF